MVNPFRRLLPPSVLGLSATIALTLAPIAGHANPRAIAQVQTAHPFAESPVVYVQSGDRWREASIRRVSGQWRDGQAAWLYTVDYLDAAGGQESDIMPERMVTVETAQAQGLTDNVYDLSTQAGIEQMLAAHNAARQEVGVPELTWSAELADYAQAWADVLIRENAFQHRSSDDWPQGTIGENLSGAQSSAAGGAMRHPRRVVQDWVAEKADYDYASNRCAPGAVCGHYTQVVWQDTTEVGCAVARNADATREVWVCNYTPAGNFVGERPY